jgi:hypothetical protein
LASGELVGGELQDRLEFLVSSAKQHKELITFASGDSSIAISIDVSLAISSSLRNVLKLFSEWWWERGSVG